MPVIYLKHREFGNKVAFSELEATYDKSNGWEEYKSQSQVNMTPEFKDALDNLISQVAQSSQVAEMPAKRKYTKRQ